MSYLYLIDEHHNITKIDSSCSESYSAWCFMMQNVHTRRVACDKVNGYYISTIFLGLDHSFKEDEPLLFETMVFKIGSTHEIFMKRYPTWKKAAKGHCEAIMWVLKDCPANFD